MSDYEILEGYKRLAEFISNCFSDSVEVVLHDTSRLDSSIIAIYNNEASGRELGGPMTDFGLWAIRDQIYARQDYIANYIGMSNNGKKLRSSTFFIKNPQGKLIGTLCVNVNTTRYDDLRQELDRFVNHGQTTGTEPSTTPPPAAKARESFHLSVDNMLALSANEFLEEQGLVLDQLTPSDKVLLIKYLYDKGLFMFRGGVSQAAKILNISEPTIYRCLKKIVPKSAASTNDKKRG